MLISIKRSSILGWKNFKRSGGLSIVAIVVLVATTFLGTSLLLAKGISEEVIEEIEANADISIYFQLTTPEEQILDIKEDIKNNFEEVYAVNYVSRHDALESFREKHRDNPVLMEALEEVGNHFPASLGIKSGRVDVYRSVSDYVRTNYSGVVEEIDFYRRKEAIEAISAITTRAQRAIFVIGTLLALIAVFIVFGTVRLSIYALSGEIRIMKLVGASDLYMQGSFIVQGFILGLVSSILSLLVLFSLALMMSQGYNVLGVNLESHIFENLSYILLLQFSIGIGLSVLSSLMAVRKYL